MGLRETIANDVQDVLSNSDEFGLSVELTGPDGVEQTGLVGFVVYAKTRVDEQGMETVVRNPVVTLSKRDLTTIPLETDTPRWAYRIPDSPGSITLTQYLVERVFTGGDSFDFIQLHLTKMRQSS